MAWTRLLVFAHTVTSCTVLHWFLKALKTSKVWCVLHTQELTNTGRYQRDIPVSFVGSLHTHLIRDRLMEV